MENFDIQKFRSIFVWLKRKYYNLNFEIDELVSELWIARQKSKKSPEYLVIDLLRSIHGKGNKYSFCRLDYEPISRQYNFYIKPIPIEYFIGLNNGEKIVMILICEDWFIHEIADLLQMSETNVYIIKRKAIKKIKKNLAITARSSM